MKRKRKLFDNYEDLLGAYYGFHKKKKMHTSASFDRGEVITQTPRAYGQSIEQEYIVQTSSLPGESEEEYVVEQSLPEESEEYVVQSSLADDGPHDDEYVVQSSIINSDVINSLSYYSSDPTSSNPPANSAATGMNQEYQTSMLNPFSENSLVYQEPKTNMPQSLSTNNPDTYNSFSPSNSTNQFVDNNQTPSNSQPTNNTQSAKEEELINDLQAILSGQKVYDSSSGRTVDRNQLGTQQSVTKQTEKPKQTEQPPENPHAIFDQIKENMQYANAYNLGTIPLDTNQLEKRFNDIETISQTEKKVNQVKKSAAQSQPIMPTNKLSKEMDFDPTEFLHDLEAIQKGASTTSAGVATVTPASVGSAVASSFDVDVHSTGYPARPTTIRPYTSNEKIQTYGRFEYEPDPSTFGGDGIRVLNNWRETNIVNVSIPQLNGKKFGKQVIKNGTIAFHNLGADRLTQLWAAWEAAGLLDKIMTFEGGYAARFIRGTQSRSPRPLSNHAWGTAFDINAPWNGFGNEPTLVGQAGCVRELVTIANNNGFFWGGHFNGHKDGMHFELGKLS